MCATSCLQIPAKQSLYIGERKAYELTRGSDPSLIYRARRRPAHSHTWSLLLSILPCSSSFVSFPLRGACDTSSASSSCCCECLPLLSFLVFPGDTLACPRLVSLRGPRREAFSLSDVPMLGGTLAGSLFIRSPDSVSEPEPAKHWHARRTWLIETREENKKGTRRKKK